MSCGWSAVGAGGLGLPEPPAPLGSEIRPLGPHRWGTRPDWRPALRHLAELADEAVTGRVADYVLASVEGVSAGEEAVHYALLYGRLGLFVQAERSMAIDRMGRAAQVQAAAIAAGVDGRLPSTGRLIVLDTPVGLHHWAWTPGDPGGSDGLDGALEWLQALPAPRSG